jgi:ribosomal protein S12 methylthiotransferase accessory factor YcaO
MLAVEGKPGPPRRNHASQEQTWQRLHALLSKFTITCGADIARWQIAVPRRMLAMSVGTGLTPAQSCISAVMEQWQGGPEHARMPSSQVFGRGSKPYPDTPL